jgi:hypothetical protein
MTGKGAEGTESKKTGVDQPTGHTEASGHTERLRESANAYTPPLNHRTMNTDGTVQPGKCAPTVKLNDLTIDEAHVKVHDTPHRDATPAEKAAAAKREMPVSNEHFRELVKKGSEFMQANGGNFNLQMKNALEEAHQSDKFAKNGTHQHIDQMLKWVNGDLCGTSYTLRRQGDKVQVFDTHYSDKRPQGTYDLTKKTWDK